MFTIPACILRSAIHFAPPLLRLISYTSVQWLLAAHLSPYANISIEPVSSPSMLFPSSQYQIFSDHIPFHRINLQNSRQNHHHCFATLFLPRYRPNFFSPPGTNVAITLPQVARSKEGPTFSNQAHTAECATGNSVYGRSRQFGTIVFSCPDSLESVLVFAAPPSEERHSLDSTYWDY